MSPDNPIATYPVISGLMALGFAATHLLISRFKFLDVVPRSQWLSAAGGAAAAYIFLHVLPELALHQQTFRRALSSLQKAEVVVYLVALCGLIIFYGLERLMRADQARSGGETSPGAFYIHIGSFCLYNVLIGYLLVHREETGLLSLGFYFVAMALHFLTTDFGLWRDHKRAYESTARWLTAGSVLAGWALGMGTTVPDWSVGLMFSFLAGGVILNVLKEELPQDRQSRFLPFLAGAVVYSLLLWGI